MDLIFRKTKTFGLLVGRNRPKETRSQEERKVKNSLRSFKKKVLTLKQSATSKRNYLLKSFVFLIYMGHGQICYYVNQCIYIYIGL